MPMLGAGYGNLTCRRFFDCLLEAGYETYGNLFHDDPSGFEKKNADTEIWVVDRNKLGLLFSIPHIISTHGCKFHTGEVR